MAYAKVHDVFWTDDKIEVLSDRAALLALFLISGEHRNAIGCFRLGIGAITDNPRFGGWGIEGVSDALSELKRIGFLVRDDRTGWTFVVNSLKHDPIKGAKAAIHALSLLQKVPKNTEVFQAVASRLLPQLEGESKALQGKEGWPIEGVSKGYTIPKPSPSPLPEPSPEPSPEPEPLGGADAPAEDYAFEGDVIRLKWKNLREWQQAYHGVQDIIAELRAADAYYAENPPPDGKWFFRVSQWLKREHDRVMGKRRKEQEAEDDIYAGVL